VPSGILPELSSLTVALLVAAAVAGAALASAAGIAGLGRAYLAQLASARAQPGTEGWALLRVLRIALVAPLGALNESFLPRERVARISAALGRAGHPGELSAHELVALMELSAAFFCALGIAFWLRLDAPLYFVPIGLLLGACYPLLWLRDRIKARHLAIARALPHDLDLLTLAVEAGLDFAAALGKVAEKGRKGPLRDELSICVKELRLGKTREEALRNLAARVQLPDLRTFAQALVHADRLGTPVGKVLRILGTQMRVERTQRAEKLAGEAPVKLLVPLVGCIFPTIFIVLFGPIAYQVLFGGSF
jgi:tight adherence protein C